MEKKYVHTCATIKVSFMEKKYGVADLEGDQAPPPF